MKGGWLHINQMLTYTFPTRQLCAKFFCVRIFRLYVSTTRYLTRIRLNFFCLPFSHLHPASSACTRSFYIIKGSKQKVLFELGHYMLIVGCSHSPFSFCFFTHHFMGPLEQRSELFFAQIQSLFCLWSSVI